MPAAVFALHTASETLGWNPHIHGMVADGAFMGQDDTFVPMTSWDAKALADGFSRRVVKALVNRELLHEVLAHQLLSQEHTGFSVWCERTIAGDDEEGRLFLGRYLAKAPVSLERITITETSVRIQAERRALPDWKGTPLDFLARLSPHIPNTFEHLERFYGRFSYAARGRRDKEVSEGTVDISLDPSENPLCQRRQKSWARLIRRIYEVDPLQCPRCQGQMKMVAFITAPFEIQRLMRSLGIPLSQAPPTLGPHYQPEIPLFECA